MKNQTGVFMNGANNTKSILDGAIKDRTFKILSNGMKEEDALLALGSSKEWMFELLKDSAWEYDRRSRLYEIQFNYIKEHYTDEGQLEYWSNNECKPSQLLEQHPFQGVKWMRFWQSDAYYAFPSTRCEIKGNLWIDLWVAASQSMQLSGNNSGWNNDHAIEAFDMDSLPISYENDEFGDGVRESNECEDTVLVITGT